ncbi:hypothetical protein [Enterovirga rhinocerotis]|uniref:Uncharacterized protein n=1 Tax=Enterovirga rhinocerotis TaxID=1339210 RepID=A0A4R7C1X2_9HYPH|nr:hypothetical protein [Enterovirga rhinocerotis]TDR90406.1 hypothetical protein EV668_3257 [Enterovirga rhinocerotis]
MRALLCLTLLASVAAFGPAEAQQKKPAAKPAAAEPAPPALFPCRTQDEICYLGVIVGSQVAILYTNAQNAQDVSPAPVDLSDAGGAKVDLSKDDGRVVMLTGTLDPKAGLKGEVVEVASPLASLAIKAQLAAGAEEPAPPPKGGKRR